MAVLHTAVYTVEMGETGVAGAADERLQACGLGACVGLCLYDPLARVAVLVHIVLPQTLPPVSGASWTPPPGKCADTAVPHALAEMERRGGSPTRTVAALVGGASIFTTSTASPGTVSRLEIGARNVLAVREELRRVEVPLCAEETGGHGGRTVSIEADTGQVWVRPVGLPERLLTTLRPEPKEFELKEFEPKEFALRPAVSEPLLRKEAAYAH